MSFRDDGKVYLEVGLNEDASKHENPHVPHGAEETARDVVECIQHGASVVHFHARYGDGRQAWTDDEVSRTILAAAAGEVDPLAYPGYAGSLEHIWALAEHPPTGNELLLAPFDPAQHVKDVLWLEDKNQFRAVHFGADDTNGSRPHYPLELDRFTELGLVPSIAVFNAVDLRWVILAARIGILRQPLNIKLFFSDRCVSHSEPAPDVMDFLVSRIPKWIDHEIVVVPYAMSSAELCQELWEHALDRGLGIRVGIGDCPSVFRTTTNAQMVDRAVHLITKRGLAAATPDDVRTRFAVAETDETELVRVIVNRNRCMGWGVCYSHAPEVYQPDSDGYCVVVKPLVDSGLLEQAIQGAASCPERAIRVEL
ncbi:3-keto-5-aminohexanoate cleavage protein [Mycobacterium alsense]|uniref:3-keto-5-aminohexanoate cleavage protein n=1 Tax=Mycobacterium alsense TaxID=324058 RepID=A0AA41XR57_9MYCO|nr:3-keto-5-aminohexanoate cleavage protein [Mycobacterium alsense]MCV7380803.1 3-keto-5-aminohexanoate cleavage protein [Mycobacterium alsense]OQZ91877.1 3-keto-5-aminohexanoate cleavage protein [Mycobacterium alsense]